MSVVRTVFLGTPFIAKECLRALHEDEHFEIVGVVSQPDRPAGRKMKLQPSPVKSYAVEQQILVLTPEKAKEESFISEVESWGAECAVVVAYGQILTQKFLDVFPKRIVNVHASLLPHWRGAAPIQRSIMAGETETGVCLQIMTKKLDAGDVIGERKVQVEPEWDAMDLHDAMIPKAQDLLKVDLMDYLRGNVAPKPQDEQLVTYAHKLEKSESEIDWSWSAKKIRDHVRGMKMGPGTFTLRQGKKLKLIRVALGGSEQGEPGSVLSVSSDLMTIATGEGALELHEVQPESKPKMRVSDYLKGNPVAVGESFGK